MTIFKLIFLSLFFINFSQAQSWEIVDGAAPVNGEPSAMKKAAQDNWVKACMEWEKKFREDNKENRIIMTSCGIPECSGAVGQKSCSSTAIFKIKTKMSD